MKKVTLGSVWVSRAGNEVVETFGTLAQWIDALCLAESANFGFSKKSPIRSYPNTFSECFLCNLLN